MGWWKGELCMAVATRMSYALFMSQFARESLLELTSCVKVEVAVLGSPSLTSLMVSVELQQS